MDGIVQKKAVLPKFCIHLKTGADNSKMIKDVERFSSLNTDVVIPNDITSTPETMPGGFLEFTSKHHNLKLKKSIGSTKTSEFLQMQ